MFVHLVHSADRDVIFSFRDPSQQWLLLSYGLCVARCSDSPLEAEVDLELQSLRKRSIVNSNNNSVADHLFA